MYNTMLHVHTVLFCIAFLSKITRQKCFQLEELKKMAPGPRFGSISNLLFKFCLHHLDLGSFIPKKRGGAGGGRLIFLT